MGESAQSLEQAARTGLPAPGSVAAWILAARPPTLFAAIAPVLVGGAAAWRFGRADGAEFSWPGCFAALLGAVFIQIGTNFANDVSDYRKGADTEERLGPPRAVSSGLLTPRQAWAGVWTSFALAVAAGLFLTFFRGWPIVAIGVASILSGLAYTGGPWPLGYNGLGDLFVLVFFGFVAACGTSWVCVGNIPPPAWIAALAVGLLATAILAVNNVRDVSTDVKAGKRTLAVRFGTGFVKAEYAACIVIPYLLLAVIWFQTGDWPVSPLFSLPVAAATLRGFFRVTHPRQYNPILAATAKLLALWSALLAIEWMVG
ncbi:MAG: 1,4-dihydroxy-2-naphthoate octaprenyltransferase [Myxococcota bacterium]|nr:1,4-dihydroxy-2-naphthoate octaprenyltransferase [Myxococcota bacterium]